VALGGESLTIRMLLGGTMALAVRCTVDLIGRRADVTTEPSVRVVRSPGVSLMRRASESVCRKNLDSPLLLQLVIVSAPAKRLDSAQCSLGR